MNRKITERVPGALLMSTIALSVLASAEASVESDLQRCVALQDPTTRLACYDEVAGRAPAVDEPGPVHEPMSGPVEEPGPVDAVEPAPDAAADVVEAVSEPATASGTAVAATPNEQQLESLGAEQLGRQEREKDEVEVQVRVVRCRKDDFDQYLFYLENGQVWKQKSDRRLFYDDCDFDVTITKDFFGYKMLPDGEKRRIRISRVR